MILDEIDQLESRKQSVLYTIFEWPLKFNTKIILIGVANALNLVDRTLPMLQANCELKPELMHFASYTKEQIIEIFKNRLEEANVADMFPPATLQMLAGKVAAVSGDVRRALDIGRRVVDLVEKDRKSEVLQSLENLDEDIKPLDEQKKIVEPKQVITVLNNVYGATINLEKEGR